MPIEARISPAVMTEACCFGMVGCRAPNQERDPKHFCGDHAVEHLDSRHEGGFEDGFPPYEGVQWCRDAAIIRLHDQGCVILLESGEEHNFELRKEQFEVANAMGRVQDYLFDSVLMAAAKANDARLEQGPHKHPSTTAGRDRLYGNAYVIVAWMALTSFAREHRRKPKDVGEMDPYMDHAWRHYEIQLAVNSEWAQTTYGDFVSLEKTNVCASADWRSTINEKKLHGRPFVYPRPALAIPTPHLTLRACVCRREGERCNRDSGEAHLR